MRSASPELSAGRWVKGVHLSRLELTGALRTALTVNVIELARHSESCEAMCPLIRTTTKKRPSLIAHRGLVKPPERNSEDGEESGAAESTSSLAYPLLPGATAFTGGHFLSAQSIYDVLSEPTVRDRAVSAIPVGPKVNCYFVVNIGAELTDEITYAENLKWINDKLFDHNFDRTRSDNRRLTVSDSGVVKYLDAKKRISVYGPFNLLMHSATYRYIGQISYYQNIQRRICWFFNSERAPAAGLVVVMYSMQDAPPNSRPRQQPHDALSLLTPSTSAVTQKTVYSSDEVEENDEAHEFTPSKRLRCHFYS